MDNPNRPPSLHELQLWMRWIITDPRGVAGALADPHPQNQLNAERYTSPAKSTLPWIVETLPGSPVERLDIYAEAYFVRVLDSMKSDFPVTARVLGDSSFKKLVSDYLKKFPSQTFNVSEIGRHFSKFVARYADLKSADFLESLIDMEWLLIELFYARDSGFLDPSRLMSLTEKDWENVEFTLAPSARLVESRWPLDQFWKLIDQSVSLDTVDFKQRSAQKQFFLFVRENGDVFLEKMSGSEYSFLQKLNFGASLVAALEDTQSEFSDPDMGSQVTDWFNRWVRRGILCDLKIKKIKSKG